MPEVRAPLLAPPGHPRTGFVALEHSFHGRTMGSLSVTWDDHYRAPFAPLIPDVQFVPADDPAALRRPSPADTAAVMVEPIQGEGGVRPIGRRRWPTPSPPRAARRARCSSRTKCSAGSDGPGRPFYSGVAGPEA